MWFIILLNFFEDYVGVVKWCGFLFKLNTVWDYLISVYCSNYYRYSIYFNSKWWVWPLNFILRILHAVSDVFLKDRFKIHGTCFKKEWIIIICGFYPWIIIICVYRVFIFQSCIQILMKKSSQHPCVSCFTYSKIRKKYIKYSA